MTISPEDVINFWFFSVGPERWFVPDAALGQTIKDKFLEAHEGAVGGAFRDWKDTPEGTLALLLLLNIFPRHMFHGTALMYKTDGFALDLARQAIIRHFDDRIDRAFKLFFYLPFTHSEDEGDHRLATYYVRERTKEASWVDYVIERQTIIKCFGRFPHRNKILGRESTPEEEEYLRENQK